MSFNGEDFLNFAKLLATQVDQNPAFSDLREAGQRSAISRAYYGVFWKGRAFLSKHHPSLPLRKHDDPQERGDHQLVKEHFADHVNGGQKISEHLKILHNNRKEADYVPTPRTTPEKRWLDTKGRAIKVLKLIEELDEPHN